MGLLNDVEAESRRIRSSGLTFGLAVDGSQMSDRATQIAASIVDQKRKDKVVLLHVSDSSKGYLPNNLKPSHLKNYYEDLVATSKIGLRASWYSRNKVEGQSTCQTLMSLADLQGVDLLVVGNFGRKGEKVDLLGTVADYSLRQSHASVFIVRSTGNKFDKQARILFASDGSRAAALAFVMLVDYLRRPLDIVTVVFVSSTHGAMEERHVTQYKRFMEEKEIPPNVIVKHINKMADSLPCSILETAKHEDTDILVLGISGYSQKKMGSVSEYISVHASCHTIVIKDSLHVLSSTGCTDLAK